MSSIDALKHMVLSHQLIRPV